MDIVRLFSFILLFGCGNSDLTFNAKGGLSGVVSNAANGAVISGVTVTNSLDGEVQTTNGSGVYSFSNLSPGSQTFTFSATSYTSQSPSFTIESSATANGNLSLLNSTLSTDKIAVVLTWGSIPQDLDSYLYVPTGVSTTVEIKHNNTGNISSAPFAKLDVDDTSSNGPETVTINYESGSTNYARTYRYFVRNYDKVDNDTTADFKYSDGFVRVYKDGVLSKEFTASKTSELQYWHVFDMASDGTITSQDSYSDSKPSVLYE
jgi:hypothetical protein